MGERRTEAEVQAELPAWQVRSGILHAEFQTGSFVVGVQFINRIADLAEEANHHPDVDLRYGSVHINLMSHDVNALTMRDVNLATQIQALAEELDIPIDTDERA